MFDFSPQWADAVYGWSNIILISGAILALVGTFGTVIAGKARDRFSDERIAENERMTAQANADAERARLEQERLRAQLAWRSVSEAQAAILVKALEGNHFPVWVNFVDADPESVLFRESLNNALVSAGLETKGYSGYKRAVGLGIRGGQEEQRTVLAKALHAAGIELWSVSKEPGDFVKDGHVEILVGSKPPLSAETLDSQRN